MNAESAAILTLAILAAAAMGVVGRQIAACGSLSLWFLTRLFRSFCAVWLNQRMNGPSPLPTEGGALLVSNHRSPLDPSAIFSAGLMKDRGYSARVVEFLTATEYCEFGGLMGWIMRTAQCIPVARNGKDMGPAKEALRRLRNGHIVGIFPEGGIHRGSGTRDFNPGVAWLALRGGVPVIPACVRNTPYREPLLLSFLTRQPVRVAFGPPVDLSRWKDARPTPEVLDEVTEYLRSVIEELIATSPRIPTDIPEPMRTRAAPTAEPLPLAANS